MRIHLSIALLVNFLLFISCQNSSQYEGEERKLNLVLELLDDKRDKIEKKNTLDSVYPGIITIQNDSLKNELLLEISYQYLKLDDSLAFLGANREARNFSVKINDSSGIAATHWDLAHFYHNNNIEDSAYYYYNQAQKIYQNLGDEFNSASLLLNMAIIQKNIKDFTGSEVTTSNAITLLKPLKKYSQLYAAYNNLGIIFTELEQYEKALEYYNTGIFYLEKSGENELYPSVWNNIGVVYRDSQRYTDALLYFEKALNYNGNLKTVDPKLYAMILDNRAYVKLLTGDMLGVYQEFTEALEIRKEFNLESGISINQLHLAEYFLEKKDSLKAIHYALRTRKLASEIQNTRDLLYSLKLLSLIDVNNALKYSHDYIEINDSLQKRERRVRNKFARIRFETDEYISETNRLNERISRIIIISATVILIIILVYIINNQRSRNKLILQKQSANQEIYNLVLEQQKKFEEGREKEKLHISRELHDGILGKLFGIRLNLDSLNEENDSESKNERFKYIREIQNISDQIRLLSHKLNRTPLNSVDFQGVLKELVKNQNAGGIEFNISINPSIEWSLIENNIKINIYRIVQEAINNIHKHSGAAKARIKFDKRGNNLFIIIVDNGVGFYTGKEKNGIGLNNIYARVKKIKGKISIRSLEKNIIGTSIKILVPFK